MQTGGYDVVIEANKVLLNNFLKLGHCMGKFPTFSGTYRLPVPSPPPDLVEFLDIGYEVSLAKAPKIDITPSLSLVLNARGEAKFTVLGGIDFELEAEFTVGLVPSFNQSSRRFHVEFVEATIDDVELNDTLHLPANVIDKLNQVLAIGMRAYLTDDVTTIQLSPAIFSTELPYMPPGDANKLTVGLGNVRVLSPNVIAAAVNLLGYTGGSVAAITDFTDGNHIGIGVGEAGMHRVYDFWWQRTTHPKSITQTGSHDFELPGIVDWLDDIVDWVATALTLGLVNTTLDIDRVWADFGATVRFGKFDFDLKPGNLVNLSGSISLDAWLKAYVQYTETTSILWGAIDVDSTTGTVTLFDVSTPNITVNIASAQGRVELNADRQLTVKVTHLDLDIPLSWEIPEFLLDYVIDWVVDTVVNNLPPIVLFPAVIEQNIPDSTVTVTVTVNKLFIDEPEALVAANIETSGIGSYAPYVGNRAPEHMEVHHRDCEWAHRIAVRNRAYYCDLEQAIHDGYDGCAYCLPEYNHG